ncbi:predicted protein [Naegleria gruberi]|uniref:Predicted protein n=1 Tax=Naegleria gruberi TaxID=5762 RepID=D2VGE9_NAEGR|nr:uncharacterized protein NAEGRDRAFT_67952 [Naegleria gruberi]EFC44050.1 predicted protein [Naegleria gruberi]|eukprot:XP_002676794.1 predicted protein [Naegleria gruberi strain NEG-M]
MSNSHLLRIFTLITTNDLALGYLAIPFRSDYEIVQKAVSVNDRALKFASADLQNSKQIVLDGVKNCGLAVRFASSELKKDLEIVKISLKTSNGKSFEFWDEYLRNDDEFIRKSELVTVATNQCGNSIRYASIFHRSDIELMTPIIKKNPFLIEHANRISEDMVKVAVSINGLVLRRLADRFINKTVHIAISQNKHAIGHVKD